MRETQINELKWITMLIALVASGLILGVMLRLQMVSGANDGSRWNTVWSLTNGKRLHYRRGTLFHDRQSAS